MNATVIDYGMGNLGSVIRSFEECGASVRVSHSPKDLLLAERIVLPGVGSFADGMSRLSEAGWREPLRKAVLERGLPLLGICLGMQLLADRGEEGGGSEGLGIIQGDVVRLKPADPNERIPHVGWNEVRMAKPSAFFGGIQDSSDFYFVHSYHFVPKNDADVIARTPFAGGFASAVGHDKICGVQFHPEKSSRAGFALIRNFLSL